MGSDPLFRQARIYAVVRTVLIGCGALGLSFFQRDYSRGLMFAGVAMQGAVIVAGALLRRFLPGPAQASQAMLVLEIVADGVTVLLFALATFGELAGPAREL